MPRSPRSGISRRDFGKLATAATLGTLLVPRSGAIAAPGETGPEAPAGPAPTPPEEPGAEARALAEILRARHEGRFDPAALKEITRAIDGGLQAAAKLRRVALANADEPAFRFRAWRSDR